MRKIIHVDMDAFYASVEQRDNPDLRGQPVIVGGRPNGRGVVAACSYEARKFGIHSAMPSSEAGRRCPQAHFLKPRFEVYSQVSQQIQAVFREFTHLVEPLSLDEAYLDVTGITLFDGSAVRLAREIRQVIAERTQLVASAGVSYNKFLAKLASDVDKPDGLYCIPPGEGEAFIAALPVGRFHGVGPATEARMHDLGIYTGADLARWSQAELQAEFGKSGPWYYQIARGIDERPVRSERTRKSRGAERTFGENLTDHAGMLVTLQNLAESVIDDLATRELAGVTLTIKVRFATFRTLTRSHTARTGVIDAREAALVLPYLLDDSLRGESRPSVRLLGASISGLQSLDESAPQQYRLPLE